MNYFYYESKFKKHIFVGGGEGVGMGGGRGS